MKANSMSVTELRSALAAMGVDSRSALEKSELVTLYMRARKQPRPAAASAPPPTRTAPIPQATPALSNLPKLPKEVNLVNAFFVAMAALFVYNNFISPVQDPVSGGSFSGGSSGGGYDGPSSKAFAKGEVGELMTFGEFTKAVSLHADDTGLPVVIDFFSQGCGPCRQIAPYFKALAREMAGEVAFYKVDSQSPTRHTLTSRRPPNAGNNAPGCLCSQ